MDACCQPARGVGGATARSAGAGAVTADAGVEARADGLAAMVTVPAGRFTMGDDSPAAFAADGEGPVREVYLDEFRIDRTPVTNAQFAAFAAATGHVSDAERFGWSFVFGPYVHPHATVLDASVPGAPWWRAVTDATWRAPFGPGSSVEGLAEHPVVHVSLDDSSAYARWAGKRLPTEAEWERAARGGLVRATYAWGDELRPDGEHRANIWNGRFPTHNTAADGYLATSPVGSFAGNAFGLFDTAGNVWEWTADRWSATWHAPDRPDTRINPTGPPDGDAHVVRGGSYLCHASYCTRYRVSARTSTTRDSSTGHTGFRCAASG